MRYYVVKVYLFYILVKVKNADADAGGGAIIGRDYLALLEKHWPEINYKFSSKDEGGGIVLVPNLLHSPPTKHVKDYEDKKQRNYPLKGRNHFHRS